MKQVRVFALVVMVVALSMQAGAQSAAQIAAAKATGTPVIPFAAGKHIYPPITAAHADVAAALKRARLEHKRVILDFGGDWCGDCQVLDIYFHQSPNAEIVEKHY